jgi:hypothetical protein
MSTLRSLHQKLDAMDKELGQLAEQQNVDEQRDQELTRFHELRARRAEDDSSLNELELAEYHELGSRRQWPFCFLHGVTEALILERAAQAERSKQRALARAEREKQKACGVSTPATFPVSDHAEFSQQSAGAQARRRPPPPGNNGKPPEIVQVKHWVTLPTPDTYAWETIFDED